MNGSGLCEPGPNSLALRPILGLFPGLFVLGLLVPGLFGRASRERLCRLLLALFFALFFAPFFDFLGADIFTALFAGGILPELNFVRGAGFFGTG
jgi:hypothetical protein